jgi:hypothetical protein
VQAENHKARLLLFNMYGQYLASWDDFLMLANSNYSVW